MSFSTQDLEAALRYQGKLCINVAGRPMMLDLHHRHERLYALRALFQCIHPQADIDRALFAAFIRPGDICLDAGANIGVTAFEMLEAGAAKVIAFEPVTALFERLSGYANADLEVRAEALSDSDGSAQIVLSEQHNQGHSLIDDHIAQFQKVFGETPKTEQVVTARLDSLFADTAGGVWKIDVEGAEHALLRGASRLLKTAPPRVILCECYNNAEDLLALLGPGWTGHRAYLSTKTGELLLSGMAEDPSEVYLTAPVYVFQRDVP